MAGDIENGAEVENLVVRASHLMTEALGLLDQASVAHSAALLDHAIATLPDYGTEPESKDYLVLVDHT